MEIAARVQNFTLTSVVVTEKKTGRRKVSHFI